MNNYYIVALNKDGVKLVELNNSMLNESEDKLHNLAYIDSITSQYDEEVFRRFIILYILLNIICIKEIKY